MASTPGTSLGPYEVLEPLGSGGMGEVYRARDPRLGREVAIKLLSSQGTPSPDQRRRFETEARAVASLSHPNVVTLFDVGTHEGIPFLVLELLDGRTLREVLECQVPTLRQAVAWALEISRGLAAAHERGIVHRDLKPENVLLTSEGRIKILDFGLAKLREPAPRDRDRDTATETRPGRILGTAGYMAPEQVRGEGADARSDVFSLGAVLYEMVTHRCPFPHGSDADALAAILRDDPPPPSSLNAAVPPDLEAVTRRCLAKDRTWRFASAAEVAAALETVLVSLGSVPQRVPPRAEPRGPYPGLASFTEEDAERFFGREAEVEALWARLKERRLLALIGPSGAGKTSFLRAGLAASRPSGWSVIVATPGKAPMRALAQALVVQLPPVPDTLRQLLAFDDGDVALDLVRRWRQGHVEALLVVDQFEELFTLSPPEVQGRFAGLLGRLSVEADVHVLLSMRDDFLIRCHEHEPLEPVFQNPTPILALGGDDLRRALVAPAKREGFTFEDESLADEMLGAVEGTRGALPLLAFAIMRLWEKRDRERKLLTRAAYEEIGGVAGALAQHAEQTLERIGAEREPIVRELFRNLVTPQGTRAVAQREELLSVLADREAGARVLDQLVDARLLTSYEMQDEVGSRDAAEGPRARHRVEIVHESLLRAWPRLLRWQAQDAEGAVLRDQLKQAAHLWEEKGRPEDLLWTKTAYQEYALWRQRYPGALTPLEADFARAMTERARRQRRLVRVAVAAVMLVSTGAAVAIGISRHQAVLARERAEAEARRAEASKLVALGRLDLDNHPTAALAFARRSLELSDTPEARRFALEVLWRGPVARILPVAEIGKALHLSGSGIFARIAPSPDGRWLATRTLENREFLLFPWDGGPARVLPPAIPEGRTFVLEFGPQNDLLVTGGPGERLRFWSFPELREIRSARLGGLASAGFARRGRLLTTTMIREGAPVLFRSWPLPDGLPEVLGTLSLPGPWDVDSSGTTVACGRGRTIRLRPLASGPASERILGRTRDEVSDLRFAPRGGRLASIDKSGEIRLWSLAAGTGTPLRALKGPQSFLRDNPFLFSGDGSALAVGSPDGALRVWDLVGPPDAAPAVLRRPDEINWFSAVFDASGRWLAASDGRAVAFWPVASPRMRALHGGRQAGYWLPFTADGRWLVSCEVQDAARLWPLSPADGSMRTLTEDCFSVATHPVTPHVLVGRRKLLLVPIEGGPPRLLLDRWEGVEIGPVAFDIPGRRAVAGPFYLGGIRDPKQRALRIWDLESGDERVVSLADITDASWTGFEGGLKFAPDGSLFASGQGGVRHLFLPDEPGGTVSSETVYARSWAWFDLSRDGLYLLVWANARGNPADVGCEELLLFDLREHTSRRITTHGNRVRQAALDASGRILVTADVDGVVRAGPITGEEPHLLLGQTGSATALGVSPDGRWIASRSSEVIHLWPMPDVTKPPLHTLPHAELMARLDALTNLHVVRDTTSSTGWKLEVGPFPGWKDVPTW